MQRERAAWAQRMSKTETNERATWGDEMTVTDAGAATPLATTAEQRLVSSAESERIRAARTRTAPAAATDDGDAH
jgi:hypothetical protein